MLHIEFAYSNPNIYHILRKGFQSPAEVTSTTESPARPVFRYCDIIFISIFSNDVSRHCFYVFFLYYTRLLIFPNCFQHHRIHYGMTHFSYFNYFKANFSYHWRIWCMNYDIQTVCMVVSQKNCNLFARFCYDKAQQARLVYSKENEEVLLQI